MLRAAWLSDIHLSLLKRDRALAFLESMLVLSPEYSRDITLMDSWQGMVRRRGRGRREKEDFRF